MTPRSDSATSDQGRVRDACARFSGSAVSRLIPLGGGDVAQSFRADLDDGSTVFAKTHRSPPPGFFTTEAIGLHWLAETETVAIPAVLGCSDDPPVLMLEWIEESPAPKPDEEGFGRALAALHQRGAPSFGRRDRRTTGSRALPNEPCQSWSEFYATQRLLPLARLASEANALPAQTVWDIERIAERLAEIGGPSEPPARLHGDLWGGNRLVDTSGRSWLIDPACHGGHREFDLAMMRLFGGFSEACHRAYDEATPLAGGYEERVALHQLAPLIVHAIKFGGSYRPATEAAVGLYR